MSQKTEWQSFSTPPAYSGWYEVKHGPRSVKKVLPSPAFAWFDLTQSRWQVNELDPTAFASPAHVPGPFDLQWRGMRPEHVQSYWIGSEVASALAA